MVEILFAILFWIIIIPLFFLGFCVKIMIALLKKIIKFIINIIYIIEEIKCDSNRKNNYSNKEEDQYSYVNKYNIIENEGIFKNENHYRDGLDVSYIKKINRSMDGKPIFYESYRRGLNISYIENMNRRLDRSFESAELYKNGLKLDEINDIDGYLFEEYIAELLEKLGYIDVKVTPPTGDFGVDILAIKDGIKYAFQCKKYSGKVGVDSVQQVYAGKKFYNADIRNSSNK